MFVLSLLGYIFMLLFMIYDIGFNWGMTINVAYGIPFCALIIYSINKYKLWIKTHASPAAMVFLPWRICKPEPIRSSKDLAATRLGMQKHPSTALAKTITSNSKIKNKELR